MKNDSELNSVNTISLRARLINSYFLFKKLRETLKNDLFEVRSALNHETIWVRDETLLGVFTNSESILSERKTRHYKINEFFELLS